MRSQFNTTNTGHARADRAKVTVGMVKHESEGAATMRSILGPTANPEVEVCFSQKYADQLDRIRTNWMPIYTKVFPTVRSLHA